MESKMFLICLFVFSCIIQSSFALKCYKCDSAFNSKCSDLTDKAFQPEECTAEGLISQGSNLFSQIGGSNNAKDTTPVCLKIVTRNITHGNPVSRRCAVKFQNQDPCVLARNALQQTGVNFQFEFCGACDDKDGCNSGNTMKFIYALVVFGTMVSTARLFV